MNPQLEFFLEEAFNAVPPTSPQIGRVVAEPNYDISPEPREQAQLADELIRCIQEQSINAAELASHQGWKLNIPAKFAALAKYLRSITLHQAPAERPWVEVAPPGNWI
ncbi:MAG: hypothetical protein ACJ74Z_10120 [Bryobacteraceae bacterium]